MSDATLGPPPVERAKEESGPGRLRRLMRLVVLLLLAVTTIAVLGGLALSRSVAGREVVLKEVLDWVEPQLNGTVEVGSLGSGGLLGGATLRDVTVRTADSRVVFSADSISGRYSLTGILSGARALADLEVFRPRLLVETDAAGVITLATLFPSVTDSSDVAVLDTTAVQESDAKPSFRIRGTRIYDGEVIVRLDDGPERKYAGIRGDFPRIELPDADGEIVVGIASLSARVPLVEGVIDVVDLRGELVLAAKGLTIDVEHLELPNSTGSGSAFVDWQNGALATDIELDVQHAALVDLAWIDARLDHGSLSGNVRVRIVGGGVNTVLTGVRVEGAEGARLGLSGEVAVRSGRIAFNDLTISPGELPTDELEVWLPDDWLPDSLAPRTPKGLRGRTPKGLLSGRVGVNGPPGHLAVDGALTLVATEGDISAAEGDTLVTAVGTARLLEGGEIEHLTVRLDPVRYGLLSALDPRLELTGSGYLQIDADGALPTGMAVRFTAVQNTPGFPASQVTLAGHLFGDSSVSVVDLEGTVSPLSLSALRTGFPNFPLSGEVSGSVSFSGPLQELRMSMALETVAGPLEAEAVFNALDLSQSYDLRGAVTNFRISELIPEAPQPTVLTGAVQLNGRGLGAETLQGGLQLNLGASQIAYLALDTLDATAWVDDDGRLNLEYLFAETEAGSISAQGGRIGVAPGSSGEGIEFQVRSESIQPLRPFFLGDSLVAIDALDPFELEALVVFQGVDPDTLPTLEEIRFEGAVEGTILVAGGLDELTLTLNAGVDSAAYRLSSMAGATLHAVIEGIDLVRPDSLPGAVVTVTGSVLIDSLVALKKTFTTAFIEGSYRTEGLGRGLVRVGRGSDHEYEIQGVVRVSEDGGRVNLDRVTLRFPDRRWSLRGPATVEWRPDAIIVSDFGLIRPGGPGLRLAADGRLARTGGESDFSFQANNLDLALVSTLFQLEEAPAGLVSVDLDVGGTSESPTGTFEFLAEDLRYKELAADRISGAGSYGGRTVNARVEAWMGDRRVLLAEGAGPADLRMRSVETRLPDGPIDVKVDADSLPVSLLLGTLNGVEDLDGVLGGTVTFSGVPSAVEPGGSLVLSGGQAGLTALGIRVVDTELDLNLQKDGTVRIIGSGRSEGTMEVRGSVGLSDIRNPTLDLAFWPRGFTVVSRRDMEATVSGDSIALLGTFDFPFIEGDVRVDEGAVFLDEFERVAQVVNFYDPFFSQAVQDVNPDEEGLEGRNPFLQHLRVSVGMTLGRDSWLRSREVNVETAGDLNVTYNRQDGNLVLQGDVQAVRGTYSVASRSFNVTDGNFQFVGTPGFDPNVTILAENRLVTREGQPLTIIAEISGSLLSMQLGLRSDSEVAVSEADLVSYLLLGQPSSALTTQAGAPLGAGLNIFLGTVANHLGYLLAPSLKLDYLSVSQGQQAGPAAVFGSGGSLQVEAGRYLSDQVFLSGLYQRGGSCADPAKQASSIGLRGEFQVSDEVVLESFWEDRCARDGFRGLGDLSFAQAKIWGFSLFRKWGY